MPQHMHTHKQTINKCQGGREGGRGGERRGKEEEQSAPYFVLYMVKLCMMYVEMVNVQAHTVAECQLLLRADNEGWPWTLTPAIPIFWKVRQENCKCEVSLDYTAILQNKTRDRR